MSNDTTSRSPDDAALVQAVNDGASSLRAALADHPQLRKRLNAPLFDFGATALNVAVSRGDRAMIDLLLDNGADIDARSDWSMGPFGVLHIAKDDLAHYLVSRGAKVDACGAARMGDRHKLAAILDESPWRIHERGGDGQTPLHFAADVPTAELLLERGADIHLRCTDHYSTPVMYAAGDRHDVARYLLSKGAHEDVFLAICLDDAAMLDRLIDEKPERVNARVNEGELAAPPDIWLMYTWHCKVGAGPRPFTPLHAAAAMGRTALAKRLIDRGADLDARGGYDDATPIHFAAWNGETDVVKLLIESGVDTTLRSGEMHRQPPLGWAIVAGRVDTVRAMLDADVPIEEHYVEEAEAGLRGEFDFAPGTAEDYQQIIAMLRDR